MNMRSAHRQRELAEQRGDPIEYFLIKAKFSGTCVKCFSCFRKGDMIKWVPKEKIGHGAYHPECLAGTRVNDDRQIELGL